MKEVSKKYYPFLFVILLGCLNDGTGVFLIRSGLSNVVLSNLFSLLEAILFLLYLKNTGYQKQLSSYLPFLISFLLIFWGIENFFIWGFGKSYNSYFNILSGLPLVLLSINILNKILVKERDVLKNADFLLCIAFIIYFTYRILGEVFWLFGQSLSEQFMGKVFEIHALVNILCNIIYALAVLCIQKKQPFTLQYS